jgi:uncharacterized membrane protein
MNAAHWHLLLNHVPVLGTVFGLAALAAGLWKASEDLKRLALVVFAAGALLAVPVYLTGEPAEDVVKRLPGVGRDALERHEDAAGAALGGVLALGVVSVAGLIGFRRRRPVADWLAVSVLLGAVVVSGLMGWTANLGGQVRHTEIRSTAKASPSAPRRPGDHEGAPLPGSTIHRNQ